jgi:hypothetical protein
MPGTNERISIAQTSRAASETEGVYAHGALPSLSVRITLRADAPILICKLQHHTLGVN